MKILVVTTRSPYPLTEGRALRTYNLIREAARDHEIVLCSYAQSKEEIAGLEHMRSICKEVHAVDLYIDHKTLNLARDVLRGVFSRAPLHAIKYDTRRMRALVRRVGREWKPDLVHLDMLHLGELAREVHPTPVVLVEHNVESALLLRRVQNESAWLRREFLDRQYRKLLRYESKLCREIGHVVAVSDVDAKQIHEFAPAARVTTVPNAVDTDFFQPREGAVRPGSLVFVGGLGWTPNHDAMCYFAEEIIGRVAAIVPTVHLTVIGQIPSPHLVERFAGERRITFTGLLDDIRPTVTGAAAFIVPLRIGGGTRLKILDALSMGKAIVTTSVGCEGLDVKDGTDVLIADGAEAFAQAVVRVLTDPQLAARLASAGRACVESKYRWPAAAQKMEAAYQNAIMHPIASS